MNDRLPWWQNVYKESVEIFTMEKHLSLHCKSKAHAKKLMAALTECVKLDNYEGEYEE